MNSVRLSRASPYLLAVIPIAGLILCALLWSMPGAHATMTSPDPFGGHSSELELDSSGNSVVSYMSSTGIRVMHCNDQSCAGGDESIVTVGPNGGEPSLELDSSGWPVVSYFGYTNQDLVIVHCGDPDCTAGNSTVSVDTTDDVGQASSLALDSAGRPVVSYTDRTNHDLKLIRCGNPNCTGGNTITSPATTGSPGHTTSLALDAADNPVIATNDGVLGTLLVIHCGNATCSSGNIYNTPDPAVDAGGYPSLRLDAMGRPVVSYQATVHIPFSHENLKILRCGDSNCAAGNSIVTPDTAGVGAHSSLDLSSAGNPVVSYYDGINIDLKLLVCGNPACTAGNTIAIPDSVGWVGETTALELDAAGNPVLSYYDLTNGRLKLIHCGDSTCSDPSGPISTPTPSPTPFAGNTPSGLSVAVPLNGGPAVPGGASITFDFVTAGGETTVTPVSSPPPPANFSVLGPPQVMYNIETSAAFFGTATICLGYNPATLTGPESAIKLMHYVGGMWVDLGGSVFVTPNYVCASTTSFSPFALMMGPPPVGGLVELPVQDGGSMGSSAMITWAAGAALLGVLVAVGWTLRRRGLLP